MAEYAVYGNPRGEEMLVADGFSSRLHAESVIETLTTFLHECNVYHPVLWVEKLP